MRGPREVIRSQISSASLANVIVKPVRSEVFRHPINSYAGTKAFVAVEHEV